MRAAPKVSARVGFWVAMLGLFILSSPRSRAADFTDAEKREFRAVINKFLTSTTPTYRNSWAFLDLLYYEQSVIYYDIYRITASNGYHSLGGSAANVRAFDEFTHAIVQEALAYRDARIREFDPHFSDSRRKVADTILNFARTQESAANRYYTEQQALAQARSDLNQNPFLQPPIDPEAFARDRFLATQTFRYTLQTNPLKPGDGLDRKKLIAFVDALRDSLLKRSNLLTKTTLIELAELYGFALEYSNSFNPPSTGASRSLKSMLKNVSLKDFETPESGSTKLRMFEFELAPSGTLRIHARNVGHKTTFFGSLTEDNLDSLLGTRDFLGLLAAEHRSALVRYVAMRAQVRKLLDITVVDLVKIKAQLERAPTITMDSLKHMLAHYRSVVDDASLYQATLEQALGFRCKTSSNVIPKSIIGRHLRTPGIWSTLNYSEGKIAPISALLPDSHFHQNTQSYKSYWRYLHPGQVPDDEVDDDLTNWHNRMTSLRQSELDKMIKNLKDPLGKKSPWFRVLRLSKTFDNRPINLRNIEDFSPAREWQVPTKKRGSTFIVENITPLRIYDGFILPIPSPDYHKLVELKLTTQDGSPLVMGKDYKVLAVQEPLFGYGILFHTKPSTLVYLRAEFFEVPKRRSLRTSRLKNLDHLRALEIAERLNTTGKFDRHYAVLKAWIQGRLQENKKISAIDIRNLFDGISLYSDRPAQATYTSRVEAENRFAHYASTHRLLMRSGVQMQMFRSLSDHHAERIIDPNVEAFHDLKEFVGPDGKFHGQCHSANALYQRFMAQYFADDPTMTVKLKSTIELDESGRHLIYPLHVVTEFLDHAANAFEVIDATPSKLTDKLAQQPRHPIDSPRSWRQSMLEKQSQASSQSTTLDSQTLFENTAQKVSQSYARAVQAYRNFQSSYPASKFESKTNPWPSIAPFLMLVQNYLATGDDQALRTHLDKRGVRDPDLATAIGMRARQLLQAFAIYQTGVQREVLPKLERLRYLDAQFSEALKLHLHQLSTIELPSSALTRQQDCLALIQASAAP